MSRIEKALILGILGVGAVAAACGDSEETPPTSTPAVTNFETPPSLITPASEVTSTPLLTPEFTPVPAFESFPAVPDEFKTSWQAILDYWRTLQYARGSLRLVENEKVRIDITRTGSGEIQISSGLNVIIENPQDVEDANQIKAEVTKEICEVASPILPEGISWNIAVPNAGSNPFADVGFNEQEALEFKQITDLTDCKGTS